MHSEDAMRAESNRSVSAPGKRALRSIDVGSMALYGAVLYGAIYLVVGLIALIIAGFTGTEGVLRGFVTAVLYAGVGLVFLSIPVLIAIVIGAVAGAVGALVYNGVARLTGGIKIDLE